MRVLNAARCSYATLALFVPDGGGAPAAVTAVFCE